MYKGRGLVVLKMGTDAVARGLNGAALQVKTLKDAGYGVVIITSGAIQAGKECIAHVRGVALESIHAESRYNKALLAGCGTRPLIEQWRTSLEPHSIIPVVMWITHGNLTTAGEATAIQRNVIQAAYGPHMVPVINENDIVAANDTRSEINRIIGGFGDNDMLTLVFSRLMGGGTEHGTTAGHHENESIVAVLFATSVGGYYTDDPTKNPHASLVPELSYHAWEDKDMLVSFLLPYHERLPNNMSAKVCAAMYCKAHLRIRCVGIGHPEQFVALVANSDDFVGTRIVL